MTKRLQRLVLDGRFLDLHKIVEACGMQPTVASLEVAAKILPYTTNECRLGPRQPAQSNGVDSSLSY